MLHVNVHCCVQCYVLVQNMNMCELCILYLTSEKKLLYEWMQTIGGLGHAFDESWKFCGPIHARSQDFLKAGNVDV